MLLLKYVLLVLGGCLAATAGLLLVRDALRAEAAERLRSRGAEVALRPVRIGLGLRLLAAALVPLLLGLSIVVVPVGKAAVRVSQISGTRPGTLYPGVHLVKPFLETLAVYDIRERVVATSAVDDPKGGEVLRAQSKEGLAVGLSVSLRYRLDPQRLDTIHANLGESLEREVVPSLATSAFRQVVPNYMVREVFATKREEVQRRAAEMITGKLAADGVIVKEVVLRDIRLPAEYTKGLEQLLIKEQESERMVYELQVKEKQVRSAELEAEAAKAREVKAAEAQAQVRVLQPKAEADSMQHTLPLKEKQIQQSRLEAEARKEATLMNAEAAAQAKVIDSKAELEKLNRLADAEAHRIRVTSEADLDKMRVEAVVLKENPLLIQKIVAERLSDKMQIMMVPMDGSNFFASEVFRSTAFLGGAGAAPAPTASPAPRSRTAAARR